MGRDGWRALAAAVALAVVAMLAGRATRVTGPDRDARPSTLLDGPEGASAVARVLETFGTRVVRWRHPLDGTAPLPRRVPLLVIGNGTRERGLAAEHLARLQADRPLVLAGTTFGVVMQCFGWTVAPVGTRGDSARAHLSGMTAPTPPDPWVQVVLRPDSARAVVALGGDTGDGVAGQCMVPRAVRTDTLVALADRRPVALRLAFAQGGTVTLVADADLLRNRTLRTTAAAQQVLAVVGAPDSLLVDEHRHGFATARSTARVAWDWARRTPSGIAVVALVVTAVLLTVLRGQPLAPPRRLAAPDRRSSAEHVRALATALAAAGGRREAVRLIVAGLRRRFAGRTTAETADAAWLAALRREARTPEDQDALDRLMRALDATDDAAVLAAVRAADDFRKDTLR